MDKKAIYRKTPLGQAEITAQKRTVDRRLRPILILTDGNRTAAHVHALTSGIGIREEDIDQLISEGYIEAIARPEAANDAEVPQQASPPEAAQPRSDHERYVDGQRYLTETAAEWLGLRSFLFVLKIEKCHTADELMALMPEFEQAIGRRVDKEFGRRCAKIAETILRK